jgi:hypothetical protein
VRRESWALASKRYVSASTATPSRITKVRKAQSLFAQQRMDNSETNGENYGEKTGYTENVSRELIDELRNRVGFLGRQLETEQAASASSDG